MKKEFYEQVTVKELIEQLNKLPQGKIIAICGSEDFYIYDLEDYVLIDHTELENEDGSYDEEEEE